MVNFVVIRYIVWVGITLNGGYFFYSLYKSKPRNISEFIKSKSLMASLVLFVVLGGLYYISEEKPSKTEPLISSEIITVDDDLKQYSNADYTSIQEAIDNANSGDTIKVYSGQYRENIVVDKQLTIEGINKPRLIENIESAIVTLNADGCTFEGFKITPDKNNLYAGIEVNSNHNTITKNEIRDCFRGVYLKNSNKNDIISNICSNNNIGIQLEYSNNNTFLVNNCNDNNDIGIELVYSDKNQIGYNESEFNKIKGPNTFDSNEVGVRFYYSNNNSVLNCICKSNRSGGIFLGQFSTENDLIDNDCSNNTVYGIYLENSSDNNTISENNCRSNDIGIYLKQSNDNVIQNNTCELNNYGVYNDKNSKNSANENILNNNHIDDLYEEETPTITPSPTTIPSEKSLSKTELGVTYTIENIKILDEIEIKGFLEDEPKIVSASGKKFVIVSLRIYNNSEKYLRIWEAKLKGIVGTYNYNSFVKIGGDIYLVSDIVLLSDEETNHELDPNLAALKKFFIITDANEEIRIFKFHYYLYPNSSADSWDDDGEITFELN